MGARPVATAMTAADLSMYDKMQQGVQMQHVHVPPVEVPDTSKQAAGQKRPWEGSKQLDSPHSLPLGGYGPACPALLSQLLMAPTC